MKKRRLHRHHLFSFIGALMIVVLMKVGLHPVEAVGVFLLCLVIIEVVLKKGFGTSMMPSKHEKMPSKHIDSDELFDQIHKTNRIALVRIIRKLEYTDGIISSQLREACLDQINSLSEHYGVRDE